MATIPELEGALLKAHQAGNAEHARILADEIYRQKNAAPEPAKPLGYGQGQGLLNSFAQAASFGLSDEMYGLASQLTGGDYDSAVADMRSRQQQFENENPVSSTVAGLAGGLATGIGGGGALLKTGAGQAAKTLYQGTGALGRFGANVGLGAASGALSGAGSATEGERLAGALTGGVVGGATGGLVQPAAMIAKKGADSAMRGARWAADNIAGGPEAQMARKLAEALRRDGMSARQVEKRLRQLGPNAMLVDVGENVRGLGEAFTQMPGKARRVGIAAVEGRARDQGKRITTGLMDALNVDDVNFDGIVEGIHGEMREIGKQYKPVLDSAVIPLDERLSKLMEGDTIKSALRRALSIASDDVSIGEADDVLLKQLESITIKPNDTVRAFGSDVPLVGSGKVDLGFASAPTLRVWDYVKRGLDEIVTDGVKEGRLTSDAVRANKMKQTLLSVLDEAAPEYKNVRSQYADQFALKAALKLGRQFASNDPEVTVRVLSEMSDPEKAMFRAGAARAARDKVLSAPDTGAAYKRIFGNPLIRDKLRSVFPDSKSFNRFAKQMQQEAEFAKTLNAVSGNSRTALRQNLDEGLGVDPQIVSDIANQRVGPLLAKLVGRGAQRALQVPEATRDVAADFLFSTDPAMKQRALQLMQSRALLGGRQAPASLNVPLASALLAGKFSNQGP
jgi:hypothetical protein